MNTNSFDIEFNQLSKYLRAFAYKLTRDLHLAEDLFQDTALLAFKNQKRFVQGTNMKAWLSTIMRNTFINSFRKRQRLGEVLDYTPENFLINSNSKVVPNDGEEQLAIKEIQYLIDGLSEALKTPFLMSYQGFKYDEISQQLSIPLGTVKSRIFLARQELKQKIKRQNEQLKLAA